MNIRTALSQMVFVVCLLFGMEVELGDAWVAGYQPFPDGEATVVLHRFCRGRTCALTDQEWQTLIQTAINKWNNAGSGFRFRTRSARPTDDPCDLPGEVAIISVDPDTLCPGDGPLIDTSGPVGRTEYRLGGARVYIKDRPIPGPPSRADGIALTLLHELGHVVGLNHPDEYGQHVNAVMNSTNPWYDLQPDDIAGIRALYPRQQQPGHRTGFLENPGDGSSRSGVGIISGWVCEADEVLITIITAAGDTIIQEAAYGTERTDTAYTPAGEKICGDTDNGFGLLFNWNTLKDGTHTVIVEVDGRELDRATVTVTTLDGEFPKGLSGRYVLENFPYPGESVVVEWEEALQNFVITESDSNERCPSEGCPPVAEPGNSFTNSIGMEFVRIPAGTFQMGSPDSEPGRIYNEGPVHQVTIGQPFYLGRYEVTQTQWRTVMGSNPSYSPNCDTCPVDRVSWHDVQDFIERLNAQEGVTSYRLPSEAEWEYTARAGTQTAYSFGDARERLGQYAWYFDNSGNRTHPVGGKRPNAFGLYDVHGNVEEWVQDCSHDDYTGAPTDGSAWVTGGVCVYRMLRGGSLLHGPEGLRSARRSGGSADLRSDLLGFRLARSLP